MPSSKLALLLIVLATGGCSSSRESPVGGAGSGGSSVAGGGAGGSGGGASVTGPIFTAESSRIQIGWFNYFSGGYRFARRREQLSPGQLALVEAIQVVPTSDGCVQDADGMRIVVGSGETESIFDSNANNADCGTGFTMVDYRAVSAVLDTVHCLPAKSYDAGASGEAPTISTGDGCQHGLFNGSGAKPNWWFRVEPEAPGEYRVSFPQCGDRGLLVELFGSATEPALASAHSSSECTSLTFSFADAGPYLIHVQMQEGTHGGDFYLSVDPTAD